MHKTNKTLFSQLKSLFWGLYFFYKEFFLDFWQKYPSLSWAFSFSFGIGFCLYPHLSIIVLFFLLVVSYSKKKIFLLFSIFLTGFFYTFFFLPHAPSSTLETKGTFTLNSLSKCTTFQTSIAHRGYFVSDDKSIQCECILYTKEKARLWGNFSYHMQAKLVTGDNLIRLKVVKILDKEKKYNLVEKRFLLKNSLNRFLSKHIQDYWIYTFLSALLTGEMNENLLKYAFGKTGLQHVMAISGSHFILLAAFFFFFLKFLIRSTLCNIILLVLMNLYFLFIGPTPSVERAFIMIQIALICELFNKRYLALQSLGISLILLLIYYPLNLKDLGFQLSYLSTFALLLFYPSFCGWFVNLKEDKKKQALEKIAFHQKFYEKSLEIIKESLALTFSVHLLLIPILLYLFHKFSLFSFLYNLFIPVLVGVLLLLALFVLCIDVILPFLAPLFDIILEGSSKVILNMIFYPPPPLDCSWHIQHLHFGVLILLLGLIFFGLVPYIMKRNAPISWPII